MAKKPNYKWIHGGFYIVRSSAGVKQAIKHFEPNPEEKYPVQGFISKFPAMIFLRGVHSQDMGYTILISAMHLNTLKEVLHEQGEIPDGTIK